MPFNKSRNKVIPVTMPNDMYSGLRAEADAEEHGHRTGAMTKILRRRHEMVGKIPADARAYAASLAPPGRLPEDIYPFLITIGVDLHRALSMQGIIPLRENKEFVGT